MDFKAESMPTKEAADYLGLAEVTLKTSRYTGKLGSAPAPDFYKIGGKVFYTKPILNRYIEGHLVSPFKPPEQVTA